VGIAIHDGQKCPLPLEPRFAGAFVVVGSAVHSKWHSASLRTKRKKKRYLSSKAIVALAQTSKSKTVREPLLNLI